MGSGAGVLKRKPKGPALIIYNYLNRPWPVLRDRPCFLNQSADKGEGNGEKQYRDEDLYESHGDLLQP
jgi:hypothetical protein